MCHRRRAPREGDWQRTLLEGLGLRAAHELLEQQRLELQQRSDAGALQRLDEEAGEAGASLLDGEALLLEGDDPVAMACEVLAGYHARAPLEEADGEDQPDEGDCEEAEAGANARLRE